MEKICLNKRRGLLIIFYILCIFTLFVRNYLGINMEDEPYHVSSVFQVLQGKFPLMSIWDGHTGFFLMAPLGALYRTMVPSLDGVVLFFRQSEFVVGLLFKIFIIALLQKKYEDRTTIFYLLPMIFIKPVLTISYNSASALLLAAICVLLYASEDTKPEWGTYLIAGILTGVLCLNYPTFTLIAVFLAIYVFIQNKTRFRFKRSILFVIGIAVVGFSFFCWIFMNGSLDEFRAALQAVLHAPHTEYRGPTNFDFFYRTFVIAVGRFFIRAYTLILLSYFVSLFVIKKKCHIESQEKYAVISYALFVLISVLPNRTGYGYAIFGQVIGLLALLITLGKKFNREHILFYIAEFLFVGIYSFTSDNKNVLLGINASAPFIVVIICILLCEQAQYGSDGIRKNVAVADQRTLYVKLGIVLTVVGILHSYGSISGDSTFIKYGLDTQVSKGVFKGIFTTEERKTYLEGLEDFADTYIHSEDKLCVITLEPMIYIMTDAEIYTPWTFDAQYLFKGFYSDDPLMDYFEQYQQYPDILIGTDNHNPDLTINSDYEINSFIEEYYTLVGSENITGVNVWAWRLKE